MSTTFAKDVLVLTATSPTSDANQVYERGITNVVEINMKNLARWMDGVYDNNLLSRHRCRQRVTLRNPMVTLFTSQTVAATM